MGYLIIILIIIIEEEKMGTMVASSQLLLICVLPFVVLVQGQGDEAKLLRDIAQRARDAAQTGTEVKASVIQSELAVPVDPASPLGQAPNQDNGCSGCEPAKMILGAVTIGTGLYLTHKVFKWLKRKLWDEEIRVEEDTMLNCGIAAVCGCGIATVHSYKKYQKGEFKPLEISWDKTVTNVSYPITWVYLLLTIGGCIILSIWHSGCVCHKCRCVRGTCYERH